MSHKIISLRASNIKALKAVHIKPDGNLITLTGENGAGKSSVLDSICFALAGAGTVCPRPIREGASAGEVVCNLDGLVVTRTFNASGTVLKVTNDKGVQQKSPQAMLDTLVGNLAFDPMVFSRLKPSEQLNTLRELVGLNTSKLDADRLAAYNERTLINREVDSAKQRLAMFTPDTQAPANEVDISKLTQELNQATAANAENQRKRDLVGAAKEKGKRARAEVDRLTVLLEQANADLQQCVSDFKLAESAAVELKDKDIAALTEAINNASSINKKVQSNAGYEAQKKELDAKSAKSAELTERIATVDSQKSEALAACKFPLAGLAISGDEITFKGIPLEQASTAEKLQISVAIGMALNPKLRVIFIRDGSLLDKHGLASVAALAENNDYQIWIEDARSTDPTAILIEDGEIKTNK